jgi:hypothetical protein
MPPRFGKVPQLPIRERRALRIPLAKARRSGRIASSLTTLSRRPYRRVVPARELGPTFECPSWLEAPLSPGPWMKYLLISECYNGVRLLRFASIPFSMKRGTNIA